MICKRIFQLLIVMPALKLCVIRSLSAEPESDRYYPVVMFFQGCLNTVLILRWASVHCTIDQYIHESTTAPAPPHSIAIPLAAPLHPQANGTLHMMGEVSFSQNLVF
ncbi:hypothetical protein BKA66DRAFT_465986 [Pyrenochaeta sp. MPI-SDFR-AT-0127]|nr:hypothetical protein BKA66DRAFT_465986 [Pyrenochaeta sp. MPI-SDFR-AT-0127]